MAGNKLDLTALGEVAAMSGVLAEDRAGKPLDLPLADVVEDPGQPRKFFSQEALESLAAQIRVSQVRSPISVRARNAAGKYVINHGARRYRASLLAGMTTIPGFIDETHDDYDRVAENILREDLAPMEIALFIAQRIALGERKGDIAARLGQKPWFVSDHLPLVDAPECIQVLARDKRAGVRTLYDLMRLHGEFPAEAEAYVRSAGEVTRAGVAALLLRSRAAAAPEAPQPEAGATPQAVPVRPAAGDSGGAMPVRSAGVDLDDRSGGAALHGRAEANCGLGSSIAGPGPQGTVMPKFAILVRDGWRMASVVQCRRVEVRYKDTGEVAEVDFALLEVVGVEEIDQECGGSD